MIPGPRKNGCVSVSCQKTLGSVGTTFFIIFSFIDFLLYQFSTEILRLIPMTGKIISQNTKPACRC